MHLKHVRWVDVDWMYLIQATYKRLAVAIIVVKFRAFIK
jgi:hypothetical protein